MDNSTVKVLIIDDNHSFIDSIKVILKELPFNFSIDSADRFSPAQKKMEGGDYSLIIMDNETETNQKGLDFIFSNLKKKRI